MGDKSSIEWTSATWNPTRGCSKASEGCRNCYAMRQAHRFSGPGKPYEGLTKLVEGKGPQWTGEVRCIPEVLEQPLRWKKPRKIFVDSMSDLFHPDVPFEFVDRVFAVMGNANHHTYQVLTKRPDRMAEYVRGRDGLPWPLPNVWLGTSVEDQDTADERIPHLLQIPAAVRFLSMEPLLGPVELLWPESLWPDGPGYCCSGFECGCHGMPVDPPLLWGIHQVIVGGESGPGARPMHPQWVRSIRDQCEAAGVPFFFKQWGAWKPMAAMEPHESDALYIRHEPTRNHPEGRAECRVPVYSFGFDDGEWINGQPMTCYKVGKKKAGRELDGRTWDEYPEVSP